MPRGSLGVSCFHDMFVHWSGLGRAQVSSFSPVDPPNQTKFQFFLAQRIDVTLPVNRCKLHLAILQYTDKISSPNTHGPFMPGIAHQFWHQKQFLSCLPPRG